MQGRGIKLYVMLLDPMASFSEICNVSSGFSNLKFDDTVDR